MANDYYNHGSTPATGAPGASAPIRSEYDLITTGFDKLPPLTGNGLRPVIVNSGGTGLTVTVGTLALAGNFATTGAFNLTLAVGAAVTITMPLLSGTMATLAGTETFTNKTLTTPIIAAILTNAGAATLTLPTATDTLVGRLSVDTLTNKTLTSPVITTPTGIVAADIGNITAFARTFLDDADAATVRTTIGAMQQVLTTRGDIVTGGIAGVPQRLGIGAAGQVLQSDGTDVSWNAGQFTTGDVKLTFKVVADTGWVLMDDKTIGNAASGATGRANADTVNLFTLLWNNTANADCAVSGGRGASAAADYAANKTIALPKTLGRALATYGSGSGLTARALAKIVGEETHVLTIAEMPAHNHDNGSANTLAGVGPTGSEIGDGNSTGPNVNIQGLIVSSGGGAAHNVMQPTVFLNVMIKL